MGKPGGRELVILWAGRHQRSEWEELCARYRRRIARTTRIRDQIVKPRSRGGPAVRLANECKALLEAAPDPAWIVALDRRGRTRSSDEFAAWLARLRSDWPHPVVFVVGSDLGLDSEFLVRARECLSFGPLTLPHELARLVLYEQIYRALCIASGMEYHRQPLGKPGVP